MSTTVLHSVVRSLIISYFNLSLSHCFSVSEVLVGSCFAGLIPLVVVLILNCIL